MPIHAACFADLVVALLQGRQLGGPLEVDAHEETLAHVITELGAVENVTVLVYQPAGHGMHQPGSVVTGKSEDEFAQSKWSRGKNDRAC